MKILLFGIVKDIVGNSFIEKNISEPISVADLQNEILKAYPKLIDIKKFAIAVNEEYAEADVLIKNSDIVAIIPPVSGG